MDRRLRRGFVGAAHFDLIGALAQQAQGAIVEHGGYGFAGDTHPPATFATQTVTFDEIAVTGGHVPKITVLGIDRRGSGRCCCFAHQANVAQAGCTRPVSDVCHAGVPRAPGIDQAIANAQRDTLEGPGLGDCHELTRQQRVDGWGCLLDPCRSVGDCQVTLGVNNAADLVARHRGLLEILTHRVIARRIKRRCEGTGTEQ
ncbi:hypothetical protein [Pararhodobacter zhoushanensis]|uniref:Uncharacterized protein n=1 Tax=Pararhodobacter zhoushanensis TaxID=2479545 RepID=A0ABT3H2U7_9RHOB|nr:hypothetical protein [Pararhodobacter zhoushanensis]MCW1934129.1 hypothetical protein [Pararhodobacter zhoushanensis]